MLVFMGNQRAQSQFDRSKWRLSLLFPIWALQLGLTMALVGLFAYRLGDTLKTWDEQDKKGGLPIIELVWEGTNVTMAFVASICTFVEIIKYFAEALTPWTMVFTHVIKLTSGIAILVLDVVVYIQRHDRHYSLIGLILDCVFILTALVLVVYIFRIFNRLSVYDDYAHPVNVKPFGFNDELDRDTSYQGVRGSFDKHLSSTSSRLSMSSSRTDVEMGKMERTPSVYTHKRDTQFDDYVARRSSVRSSTSGDLGSNNNPAEDVSYRDSAGNLVTRPRGLSAPRAPSYASDRGLVAVPEEEEADHHNKEAERIKAHDALMGGTPRDSISLDDRQVAQEVDLADPKWHNQKK